MNARRPRSVASPHVGADKYYQAIKEWQSAHKLSLNRIVGPMASELRMVTPQALVRVSGLIEILMKMGCDNAVHIIEEKIIWFNNCRILS